MKGVGTTPGTLMRKSGLPPKSPACDCTFAFSAVLLLIVVLCVVGASTGCATTTVRLPPIDSAYHHAIVSEAAQKHMEQNDRLQRVWFRLVAANRLMCLKTTAMSGFWHAHIPSLPQPYLSAWTMKYGPNDHLTVTLVAPESPAAKAGLRAGDRIVAHEGTELGAGRRAVRRMKRSRKSFEHSFQPGLGAGYSLVVDRDGERLDLQVGMIEGCAYSASLLEDERVNAFADGKSVAVTTGAMEFAESDEELAYLLGHELAHNGYGHLDAIRQNRFAASLLGSMVTAVTGVYQNYSALGSLYHRPKFEAEADYLGVYMAARAGYDVTGVSSFWSRLIAENPSAAWASSLTHPNGASRLAVLAVTADEIRRKRESGQRLWPSFSSVN